MKKVLTLLVILTGLVFPWACSDNNNGSKPTSPSLSGGGSGGGGSTPILTSTPASPVTPTPAPVFIGSYGTSTSPNGFYYDSITNTLFVATGKNTSSGDITMFEAYVVGAGGTLAGGPTGNLYTIGFPTPQPPPPTPAITPGFGSTIVSTLPQAYAYSAGYYAMLDDSPNGSPASFLEGCNGFNEGTVPAGFSEFPGNNTGYDAVQLSSPKSLAGDNLGNFYVADTGNKSIDVFGTSCPGAPPQEEAWVHQWIGYSTTFLFVAPNSVATDTNNDVWVGDAGYKPSIIQEYSSMGTTLMASWSAMSNCSISPNGLAVDKSASCSGVPGPCVYVSDSSNGGQVEEYTSNGSLVRIWGDPHSAREFLPFLPGPIALLGNPVTNIIVGDLNNALIQVFGP